MVLAARRAVGITTAIVPAGSPHLVAVTALDLLLRDGPPACAKKSYSRGGSSLGGYGSVGGGMNSLGGKVGSYSNLNKSMNKSGGGSYSGYRGSKTAGWAAGGGSGGQQKAGWTGSKKDEK